MIAFVSGHHNHHHHTPNRQKTKKRLYAAAWLTGILFAVELAGGYFSHSLALLSDAGHMVTDLTALIISVLSIHWATKLRSPRKTFGYYRMEVLAALLNGALLLFVAFEIISEAIKRLSNPGSVLLELMLPVACVGLLVNMICAFLLRHHTQHLAARSAYLHILSDMGSSAGVVLAAILIWKTGWTIIDPLISLGISIMICWGAYRLIRESLDILLEASPKHLSLQEIQKAIYQVGGVEEVHDLHVWTISSGFYALSAHLQVTPMNTQQSDTILAQVGKDLDERFGITHTTLQIESVIEKKTEIA